MSILRQVPGSPKGSPGTGDSVIAELEKLADSAPILPKEQDLTLHTHSFYSPRLSGVKGHSARKAFSYGDWSVCGDVSVKLAINQALLYAIQTTNTLASKDEKKMDCTKSRSHSTFAVHNIMTSLKTGHFMWEMH